MQPFFSIMYSAWQKATADHGILAIFFCNSDMSQAVFHAFSISPINLSAVEKSPFACAARTAGISEAIIM